MRDLPLADPAIQFPARGDCIGFCVLGTGKLAECKSLRRVKPERVEAWQTSVPTPSLLTSEEPPKRPRRQARWCGKGRRNPAPMSTSVRRLRHSKCVFKVTTKLRRHFLQIGVLVLVSAGKIHQLYGRHVAIR